MDLALVTCAVLPEPDPDAAALAAALDRGGISAQPLAWDDPAADFAAARLTVFRSCWNYHRFPDAFGVWLMRAELVTTIWNRPATIRWNMHKRYLLDLTKAGVPTVPTLLVSQGSDSALAQLADRLGSDVVVMKPAVSAGSRDTLLIRNARQSDEGEAQLRRLLAAEDVLVQPYVASVEDYGERSLIFIDGEVTHAVRKTRRLAGDAESVSAAMPIAPDELALARQTVAAAPGALLYARVDMARDASGIPMVMELELIEPSLFFPQHPPALERFVHAIKRELM